MRFPIWSVIWAISWAIGWTNVVIVDQSKCPPGWESAADLCIRLFFDSATFDEATGICAHEGAELVNIVRNNQIDKSLITDLEEPFERTKKLGMGERRLWIVGGLQSAMADAQLAYDLWLTAHQLNDHSTRERKVLALEKKEGNQHYELISIGASEQFPFVCSLLALTKMRLLYEAAFIPRGTPHFIEEPNSSYHYTNRNDGHFVTLPCRAEGTPEPEIRWFRGGIEEIDVSAAQSPYVISGGALLIPMGPKNTEEETTFHCTVSNPLGTIRSATTTIRPAFIDAFRPQRLDAYPLTAKGGGSRLDCQSPPHYPKSYSFSWMIGGKTDRFVAVTERVFISMDGTLYFSYNRKEDADSYACTLAVASSRGGQYGPFFRLILPQSGELGAFAPQIDEFQPQVFPEVPVRGQTVFIECFAYGFPAPTYKWSRIDGKPLSKRHQITNFGRVLQIDNVQLEDAVRYKCTAMNERGIATAELHLVIHSPPIILRPLEDTVTSTNSTVRFSCPVSSEVRTHVEWFRNAKPIVPVLMVAEERKRFRIHQNELAINNVREEDSGIYQCRLTNDVGSAASAARLTVRDSKPSFHPNVFPKRVFVVEGKPLVLPCIYYGMPRGKANWQRLSRDTDSSGVATFEQFEENGIVLLKIDSFSSQHAGDYECKAENEVGVGKAIVQITVMTKPKVLISQSVQPDSDGYGLRLSCEAELECASPNECPEAHFDWQFNEKQAEHLSGKLKVRQYARSIDNSKVRQHADIDASSSFVNRHVGRFACSSVFGGASAELEPYNGLSLLTAMAPTHLRALDAEATSARLSWRLPPTHKRHEYASGLKIIGYQIEHRTSEDRTWRPLEGAQFDTTDRIIGSYVVHNLRPNTRYQFRVRTRSADGAMSLPSAATEWISTLASAPDDIVKNLRWKILDPMHLLLEWDPVEKSHQSGPNLRYNVTWTGNHDYTRYGVVDRPSHVIAFRPNEVGRDPQTDCQMIAVGVQPLNDLGTGPSATDTVVYVTGQGPKRYAANVRLQTVNATHLNATWEWVHNGECENVRGAQISCVDDWDDENPDAELSPDAALLNVSIPVHYTEWIIGGLQAFTQYRCSIGAFDQYGRRGKQSRTSKPARTAEPAPFDPPDITRVKLHETMSGYTTLIDWTAIRLNTVPNTTNEDRGYRVYVYISETAERPVVLELTESQLEDPRNPSARIDGLKLMYFYKIQVAGYNRGGVGPRSAPTTIRIGAPDYQHSLGISPSVGKFFALFLLLRIFLFC